MGVRDLSEPVLVDVVFERFPASVRGAVVVRGADPDPHQIATASTEVVELRAPAERVLDVNVDRVVVDIAPRAEVLLPFELPFAGLQPGWYAIVAEVLVDGQVRVRGPAVVGERRFVIGWPGGTMRRGTIELGARAGEATIERIELKTDRAVLRWQEPPGERPTFADPSLIVDGRATPVLEATRNASTGARVTTCYPIPKTATEVGLRLPPATGRGEAHRIELRLD